MKVDRAIEMLEKLLKCDLTECEGDCLNCDYFIDVNEEIDAYKLSINALKKVKEDGYED